MAFAYVITSSTAEAVKEQVKKLIRKMEAIVMREKGIVRRLTTQKPSS